MKWCGWTVTKTLKDDTFDGETCYVTRHIRLHKNLTGRVELETLLHEADHALHPDKSEEAVLVDAAHLTDLLTLYGYRKIK